MQHRPAAQCSTSGRGRCVAARSSRGSISTKVLHVIRHGPTEMAAYMALHKYGSPHQEPCRDPMLYDTELTRGGLRLVQQLADRVAALQPRPEAVLVSPLTRCLQTATAACAQLLEQHRGARGEQMPLEVEPLLRERVTLSSEVGRPPAELRRDFPGLTFPGDLADVWWYTRGPGEDPRAVVREPQEVYEERLQALKRRLAARPERCLLLVSHWGVLNALTGLDLHPAEIATKEVQL